MNETGKEITFEVIEKLIDGAIDTKKFGLFRRSVVTVVTTVLKALFQKLLSHDVRIEEIADSCMEGAEISDGDRAWIKVQLVDVLNKVELNPQKLVDDPEYIEKLSQEICDRDFWNGKEKEAFSKTLQRSLKKLSRKIRKTPEYQEALLVAYQRFETKLDKYGSKLVRQNDALLQNSNADSFAGIIDRIAAPVPSTNRFHYTNEKIAFIGRENELRTLYDFLETDAPLQWMVVTGDGGIGKSRLLYQFSKELRGDPHWKAVWLKGSMVGRLSEKNAWTYPENLLFIVDYAGAKAKELGEWIYSLSNSTARPDKVRFVLIEREFCRNNDPKDILPWVQSFYGEGGQRCLEELRYASDFRLNGFTDEEAVSIIRAYAHAENRKISDSDAKVIYERAKTLDEKKVFPRPLIILFLVDAYLQNKDFHHWDVNDLTDSIIGNYEHYWKNTVCKNDEGLFQTVQKMLVYATAAGGWNAEKKLDEPLKADADRIRNRFDRGTLLSQINETEEDSDSLHPFEPDMIGECYVLRYFQKLLKDNRTKFKNLLKLLWERFDFAVFLYRCISDYSVNPDFGRLFANGMEALKPDKGNFSSEIFAKLLFNLSNKQSAEEAEATVKKLKALHTEHPTNEEIAVAYAKGLFNLSVDQPVEERQATVEKLQTLCAEHPTNEEIAVQYAMGLVNLSAKQSAEERQVTVEKLKALCAEHPTNEEIAVQYAKGLVNLSAKQSAEECKATVEKLQALREEHLANEEIAVEYAKGLFNLSVDQPVEERKATVEKLKALHTEHPTNEEIAVAYAYGLFNLSVDQPVEERKATVEKLQALREEHPANEEIAVAYAKGLVKLSVDQSAEEAEATVEKLQALCGEHPANEEIAVQYAMGLVNLSNKQSAEEAEATVEKLQALCGKHPTNEEIAVAYAMGLVNLSAKQSVEEAEATVEKLQALRAEHPANEEIAVEYAKGLVNLSCDQSTEERQATVEKLQALHTEHPTNEEIAVQYANGLFNLSVDQSDEEAEATVEKLRALHTEHPTNEEIAVAYANGLFNLSVDQSAEEAEATIEKLQALCGEHPANEEIAVQYAKGLFNLSFDQSAEERKATVEKLQALREEHPANEDIAAIYADACQPEQ